VHAPLARHGRGAALRVRAAAAAAGNARNVLTAAPPPGPSCAHAGNLFGFEVKQNGMELEECTPLELPFMDNQVEYAFHFECPACNKNATLARFEQQAVSTAPASQPSTTTARIEQQVVSTEPATQPSTTTAADDSAGMHTTAHAATGLAALAAALFALR